MVERFFPRPFTPRSWRSCFLALAAALVLLALDLGSKHWAAERLSAARVGPPVPVCHPDASGSSPMQRVLRPSVEVVPGFFDLRYAENCGAAFGFLNDETSAAKHVLFFSAAVGCVLLLAYMYKTGRQGPAFAVAVPFVVSGALGNFIDRIRLGYVVDFIHFYGETWQYPTFNVADIAITIGVVLLLIDGVHETKLDRDATKKQAEADRAAAEAHTASATHDDESQSARRDASAEEDDLTGEPITDPASHD